MNNPKFEGFNPPIENWSKLPHQLINALHIIETEAELKVILYILRHTWGYHDEEKKITIDEFCNGRKRRNGSRLDKGTGLSSNSVKDGIKRAIKHGFIEVDEDTTDKARIKKYYRLSEVDHQQKPEGQKLTPWGSEVDPLPSEVDPRTEKETEETNSRENTPPDFLTDVFQKQGQVSEDSGPNPQDQYWIFRDEFLKTAQRLGMPNQFEKDAIIALVENPEADLERWKMAIQQTGLHYKGSGKIARAIEVYQYGDGDYEKWRKCKYPNDSSNYQDCKDFVPKKIVIDEDGGAYL